MATLHQERCFVVAAKFESLAHDGDSTLLVEGAGSGV